MKAARFEAGIGDDHFVAATFREGHGHSEEEMLAPCNPSILASVQRIVAPTFYSQVNRTIGQRLPFIEEALAAGANLDHISFQHHGSDWTVVSFKNAKGTYLLNGDDVYVTQASVQQAQAAIESDPVALRGIGDLELAGDIEVEVREVRSAENRIEPRGRVAEQSLSM